LKYKVLLIVLLWIAPSIGVAQRFNSINYNISDGLPGSQVNKIIQDKTGKLWIGTMNGACQFDGKIFTPFDPGNVLQNNPVKTIFQDRQGNIWFGTIRKGLVKYSGTSFSFFTTNDGLLSDNINALAQDAAGNLWVGTSEGLCRFDGKQFTNFTTAKGLINDNIFDLKVDSKGRLWIATIGGVAMFDGRRFVNYTSENGLVSNIVYSIKEDVQNNIWFATYEGISKFDGKTFKNYSVVNGLPNERVEDLIFDSSGNLWLGTYGGGLGKLLNDSIISISLREGVNNNIIKSILQDREGNYWIGTWNGIFKYNGDRFTTFTQDDGLTSNNMLSVFSDPMNKIWFGSLAGGINVYDGKSFNHITTANGLKSNTIWSIYQDHEMNYWFGTTNGPAKYYQSSNTLVTPYAELNGLIIYAILQDEKNAMYFGTDRGLYRYDGNSITLFSTQEGLQNDKVRVLFQDKENKIWVGTLKGLYYLDGDKAISFDDEFKLTKAPITSIINDKFGNLLISTYDFGLIRYNSRLQANPITVINKKTGLTNERLLFNYLDSKNKLWLGTPEGVDCIDWEAFIQQNKFKTVHYDKSNGYLGVESNAAIEDTSGNIWFATVNGVIRFNPIAGELKPVKPQVTITNLKLFLETVNWQKMRVKIDDHSGLPIDLILPHYNNHLSFECSAIYLTAPDEVLLRSMLEGFETSWSPASKNTISSYSNIPPGSYVYKVQASLNGKDWGVPVTYSFSIRPPIWKTPFFYLMYIVVGAGSILLGYRLRTGSLRKSQDLLRKKVESRTKELQEKNMELAKLSLVASETDNAVMIFDHNLELEWVNTGYTKLTGYDLQELKLLRGKFLKDLTSNPDVLLDLDMCIKEHRSIIYESEIRDKSNSIRYASSTLTPILYPNGDLKNIVVIDTDITIRRNMEAQIRAALEEKGVLLREIHHRVKNNLQIIISLFNLQTSYVQDENAYKALKEGQDRIKSMALIHERFYQSDGLSKIDFDEYIKKLAENLFQSFKIAPDSVNLKINAERISLDIDTAVPCGLIINEIVSNSLKHAFVDNRKNACVTIDLAQTSEGKYRLVISDNGIGMPASFSVDNSDSLGIQLVEALTDQLEGTMQLENRPNEGLKYTINFKLITQ